MSEKFNSVLNYLPYSIKRSLDLLDNDLKSRVHEIRLKNHLPVSLVTNNGIVFPKPDTRMFKNEDRIVCTGEELFQTFRAVCGYSVHSHTDEIKRGYLSLKGGHRVGICGSGVFEDNKLSAIKNISSLNIRIARQIIGASDAILSQFGNKIYSTLIAGSPGSGKTTILRDITRRLSNGTHVKHYRTFVADERFEISSSYDGILQNDLGETVDVMCGIPKIEAMKIGIRCFSPEIMIVDEIASEDDAAALKECFYCGAKIVATTHCNDVEDLMKKGIISDLINSKVFEKIVILKQGTSNGKVEHIYCGDEL